MARSWLRPTSTVAVAAALSLLVLAAGAAQASPDRTGHHAAAAAGSCDAPNVRQLVRAFVLAFNRGDRLRLDALWSRDSFQWYSVTRSPTQHYVAYGRGMMLRYFVARNRRSEAFPLTTFRFNGVGGGYGHFQYSLLRRASDIAGGARERYHGKGAAACSELGPRLAVWSMGRDDDTR